RDFVRLVLANIATETESTTLRTVLGQLVLTATQYVAEENREVVITEVGDSLWSLAQGAEPGSDAQFQFVKFFASVASTEDQLAAISGLLDGSAPLDGLAVDTDFAWELLIALVAGGKAGTAEIDAALAKDNTATGAQSAAHARAAIPTAEGKQAAWSSLIDADTAPNTIVRTTAMGFLRAADTSLLEPFVEKYFAMLQTVWNSRSYAIAEKLIIGLYPSPLANEALADATRAWLEQNPEPAALRRLVVENLAGVDRALAVQARDAA
ncbi:MAG: aminopeptidase, partial [Cryobacterium sp.]|nr:aminopeptidase [Cryobacterium sp.]